MEPSSQGAANWSLDTANQLGSRASAPDGWSPEWSSAVFSIEERDRRWKKVRALMARAGVDVIICLPNTHSFDRAQADNRYLTQLGENCDETTIAFPIEGKVEAWMSRGGIWPASNWTGETKAAWRGSGGATIARWLEQNPKYHKSTIAIAGLSATPIAHMRSAEGEVNWGSVEVLKKKFPAVNFTSATPILGEARWRKSLEEIEFIRKGLGVAQSALDALCLHAREGVSERMIFAEMMYANAKAGGSFPSQIGWISGPVGKLYNRVSQPTFRKLARGDIMNLEIEGRWGGYIAQIDQSILVGPPTSLMKDAMDVTIEAFNRVLSIMKPGVSMRELKKAAADVKALGGRIEGRLGLHGRGTGNDGPLLIANGGEPDDVLDVVVEEDCCFALKPSALVDGDCDYCRWGDSVVVTTRGAERLGARPQQLIVV